MLPPNIAVLERGWLSSNSILLLGDADHGPILVDTGYCTHAAQTLALVANAIRDEARGLSRIINTHLHSDHCGGNAALSAVYRCPIHIPPGQYRAAASWDESVLSYGATGQQCPRFSPDGIIAPGDVIEHAGLSWQVHAAPGHDPDSIMLFEPASATLISADALWEHGFGIVFPEIDGQEGFSDVEASLDLIESLNPRCIIPGHGRPFSGVAAALAEARSRLAMFRAAPKRHAKHGAKALIMFHLLEFRSLTQAALTAWLTQTPIHQQLWRRYFHDQSIEAWTRSLITELVCGGSIDVDSTQTISVTSK
jgi:glyoxylase-like metal-dependent hydrolase (beta-lactamase superfamily II)